MKQTVSKRCFKLTLRTAIKIILMLVLYFSQ